jgi:polysaccharide export outer membrane protein
VRNYLSVPEFIQASKNIMSKSTFLPPHYIAMFMLLLFLAIPCMSSADQVEIIPESSQQTGEGSAISSTDPLTSLFQRLRGSIGRDDDKSASAVAPASVEMVPEITPPEKPSITVTAEKAVTGETAVNVDEESHGAAEKAALEKMKSEKSELEQMASKKAEQIRFTEEKMAADKAERQRLAAEKAELKRIAEARAAEEKIAAEKREALSTSTTVPATTQLTTGSQPSSWNSLLALVGLHDDRRSIPPQELKSTSLPLGQDYIIGPGDVIGISVWRDESLTRSVVVLPDGKIQFPLIGEIVAGGKTVLQLKQEFVEKLSKYVVDADISVDVKQSNSLVIYIIGKVNNPGRQILVSNTSVLQALSMAGGLNLFADKDDIKIFRQNNDRTVVHSFRYSKVVSGTYLDDNITLKRGDVIVVP